MVNMNYQGWGIPPGGALGLGPRECRRAAWELRCEDWRGAIVAEGEVGQRRGEIKQVLSKAR